MNIGEKVRSLRVAKLMTQSELAGTQMTRNMLSCIENGSANPSLSSLSYIASRLNVPVGFLLAEGGDEAIYRKMSSMPNIKRAFKAGDYEDCRRLCISSCLEPDDELMMLLAECDLEIAKEEFSKGNLHICSRYFDEAVQYSRQTLYPMPHITAIVSVYERFMSRISPVFYSDEYEAAEESFRWESAFSDYVNAIEALDQHDTSLAERYESREEESTFFARSLSLKLFMECGEYESAKNGFLTLLKEEDSLTPVELYSILSDLEICCRETEDYKGAYNYTNEKLQLQEQLLKE